MEKLKHGRISVFVSAAAIILVSAAVFIASIQIAMGAEENKIVESPAASIESVLPAETPQPSAEATPTKSPIESQAPIQAAASEDFAGEASAEPSATQQPISEDDAVNACLWVANELFALDVDRSSLTVNFSPQEDLKDENGNITYTIHEYWSIENKDFNCGVDAATGTVTLFDLRTNDYPGSTITEEEFESDTTGVSADGGPVDMHSCPDDIYIKAAVDLVNKHLANGRNIDNVEIDGVQFVWKNNSDGFDPDAEGTILVDCHVYMENGLSYTLSFWGIGEVALNRFYSHPTQHACTWGYFYEEDGADYPPESANGEWYTAPGIEGGTYSEAGERTPKPSFAPPTI